MAQTERRPARNARWGFAARSLLLVAPAGLVVFGAWWFWPAMSLSAQDGGPLIHVVSASDFVNEITERGEVESASNVEIRCEVKAKGSAGTTILEIVPEGTYVEQGDVLVRLDSSSLESDQTKQQIVCNSSEAAVIKARNTYETAVIAKQEYVEGQFQQEVQSIQSQIVVAEEDLRRAEEYLNYSKRLAVKGYVTALQLEADRFAVEKAKNELEIAQTKLRVLEQFTQAKMLKQLESDIATSKASYEAEKDSHRLDSEQLELIEEQIEKCTLIAPEPGQVVYANQSDRRSNQEIIIAPGESVREGQVIVRLPDPKRMQVKAKINEARVSQVAETMLAYIRLDAFPDRELSGEVTKVNEYPEPSAWFAGNIKEYGTIIRIDGSPPGLRPGLTAEVKILIERIPGVLQLPVQAVFEHGDKHYCIGPGDDGLEPRELTIGSTNDKTVVIRKGVKEGDRVILNAAAYREKVDLPEIPDGADRPMPNGNRPLPRRGQGPSGGPQEDKRPAASHARPDSNVKKSVATPAEDLFAQQDMNKDGVLEGDEIPAPMRSRVSDADRNDDGKLDQAELKAFMSRTPPSSPPRP